MELLNNIVQRARRDFFKWRYFQAARHVLNTPPQTIGSLPFILLSMVHKRDVISYLVAVKSFARYANPQRIVVVCDPSIEDADRATFRKHIPHIEMRNAIEFIDPRVPRGGCWERLLAISTYVGENYVVQLDADTVSVKPIPEVIKAIEGKTGFVLGEKIGQTIVSLAETKRLANDFIKSSGKTHIQDIAEVKMVELDRPASERYVRGCAGFTGFPPTTAMRDKLFAFSIEMQNLIGERWSNWGTEQITSNYLVANAVGTTVLPFEKYSTPDATTDGTSFLHFIGYTRFVNAKYEKASQKIIRTISVTAD